MKRYWPAFVAALVVAGIAAADTVKTWSLGETLRAADLNTVIAHLHTYMVGGAGQGHAHNLLVDGDVSASAAVQHSKMQRPGLFPKAWARTLFCDGSAAADTACIIFASQRVTRISSNGTTGQYRVYLSYVPANNVYMAMAVPDSTSDAACYVTSTAVGTAYASSASTAQVLVTCTAISTGAAKNSIFSLIVMDDDN